MTLDEYIQTLRDKKSKYPARYKTPSGEKHVRCPYCGRDWFTSVKGGGLITAGAIRHTKKCAKEHGVD